MQVIVLGASRSGLVLVKRLVEKEYDVILVDPEASLIADKLNMDIVCVDGVIIDLDVLREAGVEMADAVCAVSENENQNLMASQIAHEIFQVKRILTRVFEPDDYQIFNDFGFVTISSTELTVEAFVRALNDESDETKIGFSKYRLMGHDIGFDFIAPGDDLIGSKIKDLVDTSGRHVFGVKRNNRILFAEHATKIEKGDILILAYGK